MLGALKSGQQVTLNDVIMNYYDIIYIIILIIIFWYKFFGYK